jgi:hypothetical protein
MNAFDPAAVSAGAGIGGLLLAAFFLGVLHGVTPDEHTWPITMSYAIGAASGRRGMQAGLLFSAAFAVQRAIASELAYLALAPLLASGSFNAAIDLVVGIVMAASGAYILRRGRELHLTEGLERLLHRWLGVAEHDEPDGRLPMEARPVPLRMTLVHGFVAGWGTGAFAIIIYTRIAPAMPSAAVAFLPGLLFGLGTMLVQAAAGAAIGAWMRSRGLGAAALTYVGRSVAGNTLLYGGLLFAAWGLFSLLFPGSAAILDQGLPTGLPIPNLDSINAGLVLVAVIVLGIAVGSFARAMRRAGAIGPAVPDDER